MSLYLERSGFFVPSTHRWDAAAIANAKRIKIKQPVSALLAVTRFEPYKIVRKRLPWVVLNAVLITIAGQPLSVGRNGPGTFGTSELGMCCMIFVPPDITATWWSFKFKIWVWSNISIPSLTWGIDSPVKRASSQTNRPDRSKRSQGDKISSSSRSSRFFWAVNQGSKEQMSLNHLEPS